MLAFDDGRCRIYQGHVLDELAALPADSVHTVITSPPYWSLRDYKGLPDFDWPDGWRGQLGLEPTPELYVAHLVEVFRAVRRVLRPDGTLWLNLGDCYFGTGRGPSDRGSDDRGLHTSVTRENFPGSGVYRHSVLKQKDLVGIPWRAAFALQADGWWLRSDIIWSKPNPMPESVTDRPTKSHEYLFLLSKRATYFYDSEAIKEPSQDWTPANGGPGRVKAAEKWSLENGYPQGSPQRGFKDLDYSGRGRNRRSVWEIATQPYSEAHFATFPPALVEPCVKAGTSERGCCQACGAPWKRMTGWEPGCDCSFSLDPIPCTVLDPFLGSGTTLEVAAGLGRCGIGIEGNPTYFPLIEKRLRQGVLL